MPLRNTLTAGISASLSGQFRVQGMQALAGLQAWAQDVNDAGGLAVGGSRRQVLVVHYDDASSTEGAIQATTRLVQQDRVDLLFGPYSGVLAKAAAGVSEGYRRVLWNQGGADGGIYRQGHRWLVGILTPASAYLEGLLPLVREADAGALTVGIVRAATGVFPREVTSAVERQAGPLGFRLSYLREFPPSLTDFTAIVEEIQEARPQVLVVAGRIHNDIQLARQLTESSVRLNALAVVAGPITQFREVLDSGAEEILGPSQWEPDAGLPVEYGPPVEEVLKSLTRRGPGGVDYPMAQAYAAGLVAQACAEQADSLEDAALRDAANRLDLTTFYGRFKIEAETGRQIGHSVVLVQWQWGRKVVLWPAERSQGQLAYPWPDA